MKYQGFNIKLKLDEITGFIIGGNQYNCLTWMDKMGSSSKAGNRGIPATSREGAPIELTALIKHCLDFVIELNKQSLYPYTGVNSVHLSREYTFKEWVFIYFKYNK